MAMTDVMAGARHPQVDIGPRSELTAEILSGLTEGETVITHLIDAVSTEGSPGAEAAEQVPSLAFRSPSLTLSSGLDASTVSATVKTVLH